MNRFPNITPRGGYDRNDDYQQDRRSHEKAHIAPVPNSNGFEKYMIDEIKNIKQELSREVGARHTISEKLQSVIPQMDGFDNNLFQMKRTLESVVNYQSDQKQSKSNSTRLSSELTAVSGGVSKLYEKFDRLSTEMTSFETKFASNAQDQHGTYQTVNNRITTEVDNLRNLIIKELAQTSDTEQHTHENNKKQWDAAIASEKSVNEMNGKLGQIETDNAFNMRKIQENVFQLNTKVGRFTAQLEEMHMEYVEKLEGGLHDAQTSQSQLVRNDLETLRVYLMKVVGTLEVSLSQSVVGIKQGIKEDKEGLKMALSEIRAVLSAEINGRKGMASKLSQNMGDMGRVFDDQYSAMKRDIAGISKNVVEQRVSIEESKNVQADMLMEQFQSFRAETTNTVDELRSEMLQKQGNEEILIHRESVEKQLKEIDTEFAILKQHYDTTHLEAKQACDDLDLQCVELKKNNEKMQEELSHTIGKYKLKHEYLNYELFSIDMLVSLCSEVIYGIYILYMWYV